MDRKQLTREYKESARPMGVYRVRNLHTGASLVGRSVDLPAVLNRERAQLKLNAHRNTALQRDWNTLGPDAFAFEVLDTITRPADQPDHDPADDLKVLEALWLDRLRPWEGGGYMKAPRASSPAAGG
ncbi:MAG TPA: GIY-YIG nuclease family protein [Gemmatimonadaceae bacterium]